MLRKADTIQRMLANLPAKRSRRSIISLRDVVFKSRKTKQRSSTRAAKVKCGKTVCNKQKTEISNSNISQRSSRSLRSLNKVLSSRILDLNSSLIVKRKLKVIRGQQSTKTLQTKSNISETASKEIEVKAASVNSTILTSQKRKSPKKCTNSPEIPKTVLGISMGDKNKTLTKKILTNRLNIKNFFPVKKKNVTSTKNNSILSQDRIGDNESKTDIEPMRQSIYLENSQNMKKNKRGGLKGLVRALSLRKRNSKYEEPAEKTVNKNIDAAKIVESNSTVAKKVGRPKSKNSSFSDKVSLKAEPCNEHINLDKGLSKKRKLQRGFRNVINKVKKNKTEKTPQKCNENIKIEKTSQKSHKEATFKNSSKEIKTQSFLDKKNLPKDIPPEKFVTSVKVEENIQEKDHVPIVADLSDSSENLSIPEIVINVTENKEKRCQANDELNCGTQDPNLTPIIQMAISATKEEVPTINDSSLLDLGNKVSPVTIDTTLKPKCVPLVSPNVKGKIRKPNRGLNDCIAMLTSKLQHKDEKTSSSLESLFSTSSTTSMERTESRLLRENISPPIRQQKNECILKIPTFRATKSPVVKEETALDLRKKSFSSPDLSFPHSSDVSYIESTINKVIEGVIEHKCKEVLTEKFAAPKWTSVDDIIQQVVQNSSSPIFSKLCNKKDTFTIRNNVDDTIDYVINSSSNRFTRKNGSSEEKRKLCKKLRRRKKSDDHLIKDIIFGKDKLIIAPSSNLHNALESSLIAKIKENESKMSKILTTPNNILERIDKDLVNNADSPVSNQKDPVEASCDSKDKFSGQEADMCNQKPPVIIEPSSSTDTTSEIVVEKDKKEIHGRNKSNTQGQNVKDRIENTLSLKEEQFILINLLNDQSKGNANGSLAVKDSENDLFSNNNILQGVGAPKKGKARPRCRGRKTQKQKQPGTKTKSIIETCIDDCLNIKVISDVESQPSTSHFHTENSNVDGWSVKNERVILKNTAVQLELNSLPSDSEDEIPLSIIAKQEEIDPLQLSLGQNGNVLQIAKIVQESLDPKELEDHNDTTDSLDVGTYTPNLLEEVILDKQNNCLSNPSGSLNLNKGIVENSTTDSLKENIEQAVSKNDNQPNYVCNTKANPLETHRIIKPIKRKRRKITFWNKKHTRNKKKKQSNLNILIKTIVHKNGSSGLIPAYTTPVALDTTKINIFEASKSELPDEDQSDLPKEAAVCNEPVSPSDISNELVKSQPKNTEINEPVKKLIHSQKTRRKSKSSKKIDKFDNDLFKDFSLVINKKTKRIPPTSIVDDSVCDDVLDKSINLVVKCSEIGNINTSEEVSEPPLIDSVEEMDMEIEDIPINASIIERDYQQNITIKSYDGYSVSPSAKVTIERSFTPNSEVQTTTVRKSPRKNSILDMNKMLISSSEQIVDNDTDSINLNIELNHRGSRKGRRNKIDNTQSDFLKNTTRIKIVKDELIPVHEFPSMDVQELGSPLEVTDAAIILNNTRDTSTKKNVRMAEHEIKFFNGPIENTCLPIYITQGDQKKCLVVDEKQTLPVNSMDFTAENILEKKSKSKITLKQTDDFLENTEIVSPVQRLVTKRNKKGENKNKLMENQSEGLTNLSFEKQKSGKEPGKAITEKLKDEEAKYPTVYCSIETSEDPKTIIILEQASSEEKCKKFKSSTVSEKSTELSLRKADYISPQGDSLNFFENASEVLTLKKRTSRKSKYNKKYTEDSKQSDKALLEPGGAFSKVIENNYENKWESNDIMNLSSSFQKIRTRNFKNSEELFNETAEINTRQNLLSETLSKTVASKDNKSPLQSGDVNSECIDIFKKSLEDSLHRDNCHRISKNEESSVDLSTHQAILLTNDKPLSKIPEIETSIQPTLKTLKSKNNDRKNTRISLNSPDDDTKLKKSVNSEILFPNDQSLLNQNILENIDFSKKSTRVFEKLLKDSKTKEMNCRISTEKISFCELTNTDELTRDSKNQFQEPISQRRSPRKTKNCEKISENILQFEQNTGSCPGNRALSKMLKVEHSLKDNDFCINSTEISDSISKKGNTKKSENGGELTFDKTKDTCLLAILEKKTKDILEKNVIVESANVFKLVKESIANTKSKKSKNSKKEFNGYFSEVAEANVTLEPKNIPQISWVELVPKKKEDTRRNKEKISSAVGKATGVENAFDSMDDSHKYINTAVIQEPSSHELQPNKKFIDTSTTDSVKVAPAVKDNIEDSGFLERSLEESSNNKEICKGSEQDAKQPKIIFKESIDSSENQFYVNRHKNRSKTPINDKHVLECATVASNKTPVEEAKTFIELENESLTAESPDVIAASSKTAQSKNFYKMLSLSEKTKTGFKKNLKRLQDQSIKLSKNIRDETTQEYPIKVKKCRKSKKHHRGLSENLYDKVAFSNKDKISVTLDTEVSTLFVYSFKNSETGTEKKLSQKNAEGLKIDFNQLPKKSDRHLLITNSEQDSSISEQVSNDTSLLNPRRSGRNRSTLKPSDEVATIDPSLVSNEINSNYTSTDLLQFINLDSTKAPEVGISENTRTLKYHANINHEVGKSRRSRKNINYNEENLEERAINLANFEEIQKIKEPARKDVDQNSKRSNKGLQKTLGVNTRMFDDSGNEKEILVKQGKVNQDTLNTDESHVSKSTDFSEMPKLIVDLELIDKEYDGLIKSLGCSKADASFENLIVSNKNYNDVNKSKEMSKESNNVKQLNNKDISEVVLLQDTTKDKLKNELSINAEPISKRPGKNINSDKLDACALDKLDTIDNETTKDLNIFDFEESVSTPQDIIEYKKSTRKSAIKFPEATNPLEPQGSPVIEDSEKHINSCNEALLGRRSRKNVNYNDEKWELFVDNAQQDNLISAQDYNLNLEQVCSIKNNNKKQETWRNQKLTNSKEGLEEIESVEIIRAAELLSDKEAIFIKASSETRPIRHIRKTRKNIDYEDNLLGAAKTVIDAGLPKDTFDATNDTSVLKVDTLKEKSQKQETTETLITCSDELLNIDNLSDGSTLQPSEASKCFRKPQITRKSKKLKKLIAPIAEPVDIIKSSLALPETVKTPNTFSLKETLSDAKVIKNSLEPYLEAINGNEETTSNNKIPLKSSDPSFLSKNSIGKNQGNAFKTPEISNKKITETAISAQVDKKAYTQGDASDLSNTYTNKLKMSKFKKPQKNIMDIDVANILDTEGSSENRRSSRKKSSNYEKRIEPVGHSIDQMQSHFDESCKNQLNENTEDTEPRVITTNLEYNKSDLTYPSVVKDSNENKQQLEDIVPNPKEFEPDDTSLDSNESVPLLDRMTHFLTNLKNNPYACNNSNADTILQSSNSITECIPDKISKSENEVFKNTENSVNQSIHGNFDALLPLDRSDRTENLILKSKSFTNVKNKGKKRRSSKKKFNKTKNTCENHILAESKTILNPIDVSGTEELLPKLPDQEHQLTKVSIKHLLLSTFAPPKSNNLSEENKNVELKNKTSCVIHLKESNIAKDCECISDSQNSNITFETNTTRLKGKKLKDRKCKPVASMRNVIQIFNNKDIQENSNLYKTKNKYGLGKNLNFSTLKNVLSTIVKPGERNKRTETKDMFSKIKPLTDIITSSEMDIAPVLDEIDKSLESEGIFDFNEEISVKSISSKNNKTNKNRLRSRSCPKPDVEQTEMLLKEPTRINSTRSAKVKALENIHEKAITDLNYFVPEAAIGALPRKSRRRSKSLNASEESETSHLGTDNKYKNYCEKAYISSTVSVNNLFSIQDGCSDNAMASEHYQTEESERTKMEDSSYAKALGNPSVKNKNIEHVTTESNLIVHIPNTNKNPQNVNQNNNLPEIVESDYQINSSADCQELRRSRRGSRKVASYNENYLIDPLIDALENRRNRSIKKDKSVERHSIKKDPPKDLPTEKLKLNSEELFDLLKNSSYENENLNILKPRNSFLENLNEPNSNTDFQDITDEEFNNILEKPSLILTDMEKLKDIDKIYEFNEDSPENTQVKEFGINKKKLTTSQEHMSVEPKINSVCNNSDENSLSSYASKEKDVELEKSNYCDICKKTFIRLENLIKHKTTLTHISKLSELEAKEAEERARLENKKQCEEKSSNLLLKASDSLRDEINIRDILQQTERTHVVSTPKTSPSLSNQPLNLIDIINDVLNKPVLENFNSEKHGYPELTMQNPDKSDIRRYKSLGERKSFESEGQLSRINTPLSESYIPSALSKTTILENQIHLLENIIGNKLESLAVNKVQTENNFIEEVSSCSNNSNISAIENHSCASNRSAFNRNSEKNQVNLHAGFIKPSQYEEISEDSATARVYEDLKLRKTLNRDEELFLECCSLLKSGSEVSNSTYSKNVKKPLDHFKKTDPELLENKKLIQTVEEAHEYSDNSRTPTPLGDTYDDEASNSNTISSNWNLKSEKPLDKNRSFSFEEVVNKEESGISFGEILTKGLRNQFEYLPKSDERIEEEFQEVQLSKNIITDDRRDDSDCSSTSKKISTKGARKVFEGLKVSIPTEDLNLDLLNNSLINKKSESKDTSPSIENQTPNKPRSTRKSKPVKKSQVGSNLLFKINKKKTSIQTNSTTLPEKQDIYNFEDTQDNTDIFTKPQLKNVKPAKPESKDKIIALDSDIDSLGYADSIGADAKSVSSVSSISAISTKKPAATPENITKKKYKIMGKIFRNAAKCKIDEIDEELRNIPEIPEIDNLELVQNYVRSCQTFKSPFLPPPLDDVPKKPKMTEEEMNVLFDQLLGKEKNEPPKLEKPISKVQLSKSRADSKSVDIKKKVNKVKNRKRARVNSDSSDDEFNINKTAKKRASKKNNQEDSGINLELELKECIGVASRKSQRKCTSGKQNILVEYWSSDEEAFEVMLSSQKVQPKKEEEYNKSEQKGCAIEELPKKEPHSEIPSISTEKLLKPKLPKRKSQSFKKSKILSNKNSETSGMVTTASIRRKRAAANPLYHWSSSSEDESQSLIEIKPIREEDDEEDRPIQHGWIVGDSPKKLVTMLALTKGKKNDIDSVKEQGKRRTSNTVS